MWKMEKSCDLQELTVNKKRVYLKIRCSRTFWKHWNDSLFPTCFFFLLHRHLKSKVWHITDWMMMFSKTFLFFLFNCNVHCLLVSGMLFWSINIVFFLTPFLNVVIYNMFLRWMICWCDFHFTANVALRLRLHEIQVRLSCALKEN